MHGWRKSCTKKDRGGGLFLVPYTEVFSNQLLDDLDKLWELRYWIPDPTDPKKCVVEVGR